MVDAPPPPPLATSDSGALTDARDVDTGPGKPAPNRQVPCGTMTCDVDSVDSICCWQSSLEYDRHSCISPSFPCNKVSGGVPMTVVYECDEDADCDGAERCRFAPHPFDAGRSSYLCSTDTTLALVCYASESCPLGKTCSAKSAGGPGHCQ